MTSSSLVPYDELNVPIRRFHITEDKFGWIVFFFSIVAVCIVSILGVILIYVFIRILLSGKMIDFFMNPNKKKND